eukprot:6058573-Amphidinium_carterae.2
MQQAQQESSARIVGAGVGRPEMCSMHVKTKGQGGRSIQHIDRRRVVAAILSVVEVCTYIVQVVMLCLVTQLDCSLER